MLVIALTLPEQADDCSEESQKLHWYLRFQGNNSTEHTTFKFLRRYILLGTENLSTYKIKTAPRLKLSLRLEHGIDFLEGDGTKRMCICWQLVIMHGGRIKYCEGQDHKLIGDM